MNNKLKNYSEQPDPGVWDRIRKTLRRQEFRRQVVGGVVGAVIVVAAIVVVTTWPDDARVATAVPVAPQALQAVDRNAQVAPKAEQSIAEVAQTQTPRVQAAFADSKTLKNEPITAEHQSLVESQPITSNATSEHQGATVVESEPMVDNNPVAQSQTPAFVAESLPTTDVAKAEVEDCPASKEVKNTNSAVEDTILWVPNAFAPSSDNPDITTFRARLNQSGASVANYRIRIFNRQGHLVFHSIDINQAWDGTYKGRALPQGGYVYVIRYVDRDGLIHQRKGTVALIR